MSAPFRPSRQTFFWLFLSGFYLLWTAAWLLRVGPVERWWGPWLADQDHDTLYWLFFKALIWVLPMVLYLRGVHGVGLGEYLGLSRSAGRGWKWGLASSALLLVLFLANDLWARTPLLKPIPFMAGPFLNAVPVSPALEEVFFRGFMVRQLQSAWGGFAAINLVTTLAWAFGHWIGWHFQGQLSFPGSLGMTLKLGVLGLLFGFLNRKADSLWPSVVLHTVNNLYSSHFWCFFLHRDGP